MELESSCSSVGGDTFTLAAGNVLCLDSDYVLQEEVCCFQVTPWEAVYSVSSVTASKVCIAEQLCAG